jgi:endo-alpha-1,4-polygalactosaminidase (GH114 family)
VNRPRTERIAIGAVVCLVLAIGGCAQSWPGNGPWDWQRPVPGETTPTAASPEGPGALEPGAEEVWRPSPGASWQWQLDTGAIDEAVEVEVYNVDGFAVPSETVARLHAAGRRVICYISAGAWEEWRPDASAFPSALLGSDNGWPGERWVDVRELEALRPLLAARFDLCQRKGFDAVEPDNVDGYLNDSGFPLDEHDQLAFLGMLAELAHERKMSIALKNAPELVPTAVGMMDFAIVEQCYEFDECASFEPFIENGKAVLHVEYEAELDDFCDETSALGFSSMRKRLELGAWREPCP